MEEAINYLRNKYFEYSKTVSEEKSLGFYRAIESLMKKVLDKRIKAFAQEYQISETEDIERYLDYIGIEEKDTMTQIFSKIETKDLEEFLQQ